jgi:transposase
MHLAGAAARFSALSHHVYYFAKWQEEGVWERINHALRDRVRLTGGEKSPECCDYRQSER